MAAMIVHFHGTDGGYGSGSGGYGSGSGPSPIPVPALQPGCIGSV